MRFLNEYTKACRNNKYIGAKMKQEIEENVWVYIKQQMKSTKIDSPVKINFTWIEENKKRPKFNFGLLITLSYYRLISQQRKEVKQRFLLS